MSTETQTLSLPDVVFGDLEGEYALLRKLLERIPDDKFDWKPHEKSMSLGDLATHTVNLVNWQKTMLEEDHYDLSATPTERTVPTNRAELLDLFDRNLEEINKAIASANEEGFGLPWSLKHGEQTVFTAPRALVFRNAGVSHMVHHRAQLGLYLRMLDATLPASYGPSADDNIM